MARRSTRGSELHRAIAHPLQILVADADPGICRLLRNHFGAVGYDVVTAGTAGDALTMIQLTRVDLAILCADLDKFESESVVLQVRSRFTVPIIALVPPGSMQTLSQILDHGADDFVGKPFFLEELTVRTRRLLRSAGR